MKSKDNFHSSMKEILGTKIKSPEASFESTVMLKIHQTEIENSMSLKGVALIFFGFMLLVILVVVALKLPNTFTTPNYISDINFSFSQLKLPRIVIYSLISLSLYVLIQIPILNRKFFRA